MLALLELLERQPVVGVGLVQLLHEPEQLVGSDVALAGRVGYRSGGRITGVTRFAALALLRAAKPQGAGAKHAARRPRIAHLDK